MAAPLTPEHLQCLAAITKFGRKRLRETWATLHSTHTEETLAPLTLAPAQRPALLAAVNAERLPWQALGEQLEHHQLTALIGEALPPLLQAIPDPPLALYLRGEPTLLPRLAVAIVGARRASSRAVQWTEQLAFELTRMGLLVVSGMAFGIDAAAHRGALLAGGTLAVLGSGLLRPAPRTNVGLMERILEAGGGVVSEYSPTREANKYQFPERNRIVTGLCLGVLVVEAGARSGSLISARLALEQGREVMAVPGPVGLPGSVGCHRLLKQGAALVESAVDVRDALGLSEAVAITEAPAPVGAPGTQEGQLLAHVDATVTTVDTLVATSGLSAAKVATLLTQLELDGFVQRQAEGYIRSP